MVTRHKWTVTLILLAALIALLSASGCSRQSTPATEGAKTPAAQPAEQKPQPKIDRISLAAASPGGSLYVAGSNLSKVIQEKMGVSVSVESTSGTVANHQLIDSGQVLLGFGMTADSADGWEGTAAWTGGKQLRNIRSLAPMYPIQLQMVATKASGIQSLSDLQGKRVALGPAGSGHDQRWRSIFTVLNIKPGNIINVPLTDASDMFRDKRIDALGMISTVPTSTIADLDATTDLLFISFTDDEIKKIESQLSWAKAAIIPAKSYSKQAQDLKTVSSWIYLAANPKLDNDFVYQLLKVLYENQAELEKANKNFKTFKPENINNLNIPLHPGAVKYYQENKITIPRNLMP